MYIVYNVRWIDKYLAVQTYYCETWILLQTHDPALRFCGMPPKLGTPTTMVRVFQLKNKKNLPVILV